MWTTVAHPNIALVKYWGKRDIALNLPATGSLSLTLAPIRSLTRIEHREGEGDALSLDGTALSGKAGARLSRFLDLMRARAGRPGQALTVASENDFPTAAGLASSSSGFAALALCAAHALGMEPDPSTLSELARRGSGSAARSVFGGYVRMDRGTRVDGRDAIARQVAPSGHWALSCVIALTAVGPKDIGSTEAMLHTAETSPYHDAWVAHVPPDLVAAEAAIEARDFARLATVAERSCLRMHAAAMAADPGLLYWKGATVELLHVVRGWRRAGRPVFFTIDAGPHVKVFCPSEHASDVAALLEQVPGVRGTVICQGGEGARLVAS